MSGFDRKLSEGHKEAGHKWQTPKRSPIQCRRGPGKQGLGAGQNVGRICRSIIIQMCVPFDPGFTFRNTPERNTLFNKPERSTPPAHGILVWVLDLLFQVLPSVAGTNRLQAGCPME